MKTLASRRWTVLGFCAGLTLALIGLNQLNHPPLERAELFFQDGLARNGRPAAANPDLVLIGIDRPAYEFDFKPADLAAEPALESMRRTFPWSREVWARLIERLAGAGAKVIALDLVFATASDHDEALRLALDKYRDRVVVGCNVESSDTDRGGMALLQFPGRTLLDAGDLSHPVADERVGLINIRPDQDEILRRVTYRSNGDELFHLLPDSVKLESLAARMIRKAGRADRLPAGTWSHRFRYTGAPGAGFRPRAVGDVLAPSSWETNYARTGFFKDKIVLIGPTSVLLHDYHDTPFGSMAGPEIQLNLVNAGLQGEFLEEPSRWAQNLILAAAGFGATLLCLLLRQPLRRFLALLGMAGAYFLTVWVGFNASPAHAIILPLAAPLLLTGICGVATLGYDYLVERFEKRRVRRTLERYVSKDVVKEVLDNPATYLNSLGGVRRPVTILFSDVRGFTTLTENADSSALVKQLNEYFEEMVRIVFAHQGRLDKFIGDAVMADWGFPVSAGPAADAQRAVATALAMKQALARLNENWKSTGRLEFQFGIGINHGDVIVGNIGSLEKMEATVIGDAVNLASRLEGLTKEYHLDLLLGESMAALVGDKYLLRLVDSVQVKGKTKPVDIFTVVGEGAAQTVSTPFWLARYESAVRRYRQREFVTAANQFTEALSHRPGDTLCEMYLKRCQALIANPPDDTWNGVFVMTRK